MNAKVSKSRSKAAKIIASKPRRAVLKVKSAKVPAGSLRMKRILVPIDFSEEATKALKYAVPLAEEFGATIQLLYVFERPMFNDPQNVTPFVSEQTLLERARKKLLELAADEIDEIVPVSLEVRAGRPWEEITAAARSGASDLIIVGTHGYTGLKHVLMGSTAERVVRHAPCPVLAVREEEREFV
jgi:nucleotide-binding universal stress UspA family protein